MNKHFTKYLTYNQPYDTTNTTPHLSQVNRKVATTSIVIVSYEISSSSCVGWKFNQ